MSAVLIMARMAIDRPLLPPAQGRAGIFDACKVLKMGAFGNRVFECGADHGQDGH